MLTKTGTQDVLTAAVLLLQGVSAYTTTNSGCAALVSAGLKSQILYPGTISYAAREASYWSASAPLAPLCIVQPRNTAEVATVIKTLGCSNGNFSVRSGGHGHWAGASDIHQGVTIDLGLMNATTYNADTTLASIQPGPKWGSVFATLEAQGVAVAGGRDANVGIAGFLTGGGNSYYTARYGMACDTVVNYEVVLANGSIVNANASSNADLFKALKGGSGNFGIVTRFDMQAFSTTGIWGGMRVAAREYGDTLITELINFTNNQQSTPADAFIINFTYNPGSFSDIVIAMVTVDTVGTVDAPAFDQIAKVPTLVTDLQTRTMTDITTQYVLPSGLRNVWFTLTMRNDFGIVQKAAAMHDDLVAELKTLINSTEFTTQCLFQPIPAYFAEMAAAKGGNMLGMDAVKDNALMWLITGTVKTEAQEVIMQEKLSAFSATLEQYATDMGGNMAWRYLNYADPSQDPLSTYGAANIQFMKDVATKYDPEQVFQKKVPGAFRLSRL